MQNSILEYTQDDGNLTKVVASNIFKKIKWKSDVLSLLTKPIVFISLSIATIVVSPHIVGLSLLAGKVMGLLGSVWLWFSIENSFNGCLPALSQAYRNQSRQASKCISQLESISSEFLKLKLEPINYFEILFTLDKIYENSLAYQTSLEITSKGGKILFDYPDDIDQSFVGVALVKDDQGKYRLDLCPGGGYGSFSKEDFDQIMPAVVRKLKELDIIPTSLNTWIGRHSGDTIKNFEEWLRAHT